MRKIILSTILGGVILNSSAADYLQSPGHFGGFGSDDSIAVADEFMFDQDTPINAIAWWGGDFGEPGTTNNFAVRIFADNGGQPGALLLEVSAADIQRHRTGQFVNAETPRRFSLYREYRYELALSSPFVAQAGTKYWLSIVNRSGTWLWEASASPLNLGVQRALWTSPIFGPWEPYFDNTAFKLETVRNAPSRQ